MSEFWTLCPNLGILPYLHITVIEPRTFVPYGQTYVYREMSKENERLGSDRRPRSPWQLTPKPFKIADPGSGFKTPNSKLNVSFDKKFCSDYKQVNGRDVPAVGPGTDHQLKGKGQ